jgi:hypothetical protein
MEVHQHSHPSHGKKTWSAYFWEFLMLFLAVFCGFLAENFREHQVEHQRAEEYAILLVKDLENDTTEIQKAISALEKISSSIDSISTFIYKGVSGNKVPGSYYYHSQIGSFTPYIVWNDATLVQLTQSGNLRYFRNHQLVNKISNYFSRQDYLRTLMNGDRDRREKTIALRSKMLNNHYYNYYSTFTPNDPLEKIPGSLLINLTPIQSNDLQLLNEYANSFENRRGYIKNALSSNFPKALLSAKELIVLLKKEYDMK